MDNNHWHRQQPGKPQYPDLLWSKPENAAQAGKLLIIGGNAHGFAAPAEAYSEAQKAGIGVARVLIPDSLQKTVGRVFAAGEYAPSTPSGSFAQQALSELLSMSNWADGVLLAGDLGRNSETAILLEKYLEKYSGQLTLSQDAVDYFIARPNQILRRDQTLLVVELSQLQKLAAAAHFTQAFTSTMDLVLLIERLQAFTEEHELILVTKHLDSLIVAVSGKISTTKQPKTGQNWQEAVAAYASTWWLQNPSKAFPALTSAIYEYTK